jgi:Ftsk gamma domain/TIR domain
MANQKSKIFISYRRDDEGAYLVSILSERLQERYGSDSVFYDVDNIPLGVDFRQHLSSAIGKASVMLVVMGERWAGQDVQSGARRIDREDDFVRIEVEEALNRNILVVPVLVGKAKMPSNNELPTSISELAFKNAAEVRTGRDFESHMIALLQGLDTIMGYVVPTKKAASPKAAVIQPEQVINGNENIDELLYDQAVEFVLKSRIASVSAVQRHLRIGYNRAQRLVEQMEKNGVLMQSNSDRELSHPTEKQTSSPAKVVTHSSTPAPTFDKKSVVIGFSIVIIIVLSLWKGFGIFANLSQSNGEENKSSLLLPVASGVAVESSIASHPLAVNIGTPTINSFQESSVHEQRSESLVATDQSQEAVTQEVITKK